MSRRLTEGPHWRSPPVLVGLAGGGRGGLPSCALGDGHCGWKRAGRAARVGKGLTSRGGRHLRLPLGLALGSPIFPSSCEGQLGVALGSVQGRRDLTYVAPDPAESRGAPPPPQDPSPLGGTLGSSLQGGSPSCSDHSIYMENNVDDIF